MIQQLIYGVYQVINMMIPSVVDLSIKEDDQPKLWYNYPKIIMWG